jgi:hypothetical protein
MAETLLSVLNESCNFQPSFRQARKRLERIRAIIPALIARVESRSLEIRTDFLMGFSMAIAFKMQER